MVASVTAPAPEFTGMAVMPDGSFKEIKLSDYKGKYVVLFFYPLDFTYVCPTEIVAFSKKVEEFKKKNVEVIGCSVDSHFTHAAWRNTPLSKGGIGEVAYPLLSDLSHQISKDYGVYINMGVALRGLFVIDKAGIVRHQLVNDLPLGRSIDEVMRMVDAIQFTEEHGEVCPANWQQKKSGMKPTAEGVAAYMTTLQA